MDKAESNRHDSTGSKKDNAIKARIMKHMNTDHADSLILYLRHYNGLSPTTSASAKLVDMSYSSLTIDSFAADGAPTGSHTIPIEPRMESWSDVRPRVVVMDHDARTALGLPPISSAATNDDHSPSSQDLADASSAPPSNTNSTSAGSGTQPMTVITYDPPHSPLHFFIIFLVIWFYSTYFAMRAGRLGPGDWYWENVMCWFPVWGAKGYRWLNEALAWPVVAVHGAETAWIAWRLEGAGVRAGTRLWWMWIASTLLEGGGALQRFGAVVARGGGRRKDKGRKRRGS